MMFLDMNDVNGVMHYHVVNNSRSVSLCGANMGTFLTHVETMPEVVCKKCMVRMIEDQFEFKENPKEGYIHCPHIPEDIVENHDTLHKRIERLENIHEYIFDIGVYAKSVVCFDKDDPRNYSERTDYMNGYNAAVLEMMERNVNASSGQFYDWDGDENLWRKEEQPYLKEDEVEES